MGGGYSRFSTKVSDHSGKRDTFITGFSPPFFCGLKKTFIEIPAIDHGLAWLIKVHFVPLSIKGITVRPPVFLLCSRLFK